MAKEKDSGKDIPGRNTHERRCRGVESGGSCNLVVPRASRERVEELGLERKQRVGLRETCVPWRELELCSMEVLSHP